MTNSIVTILEYSDKSECRRGGGEVVQLQLMASSVNHKNSQHKQRAYILLLLGLYIDDVCSDRSCVFSKPPCSH